MNCTLEDGEFAVMAGMDALIDAQEKAADIQRRGVLDTVKGIVSQQIYEAIVIDLGESGYTSDYRIVNAPEGRPEDQGAPWGDTFVNQTTGGGETGDEFSGTVSIPLGNGQYFQYAYAM